MDELKAKYGITDDAIYEIADSLEPNSEAPELPTVGNKGTPPAPEYGGLPQSLASAMRGDINIAEAIILMDFMDRKEDRRDRRTQPQDSSSSMEKLVNEMREERKQYQASIEKLILGKRTEDAEEKSKRLEEELKAEKDTQRQREATAAAVKTAVSEVEQRYGQRLDQLANQYRDMTPAQQKGYFDDIAEELGSGFKEQFKEMIMARLKPPTEPVVRTDETGKPTIDWGNALDRLFGLGDKYLETQKEKPPKLPVVPMQPGGVKPPLVEAPSKGKEGAPEEQPPEEPAAPPAGSPVPVSGIAGIGPAREKELAEMGVTDAQHLSKLSPKHLAESLKISKEKAEDIINQAKDKVDQA